MKLIFIKINLVLVLCLVLVACDHNDEKFYSIPKDEIYAEYLFARTDEVRQEIIDGINNGTITSIDDVDDITDKMSPVYGK